MKIHPDKGISFEELQKYSDAIIAEVEKAIVGKREFLEKFLTAFLSSAGHILIEDYPGLAKTLIANSFANALGMQFKRIQFTPDLMPGDITGGYIFDHEQNKFILRKGPLFTNILLADEINRASPKTQSALLEAMQEHQVTMEGDTFELSDPFIVVATQNPIEYEGTFPLPEAQLDRFIVRLNIGYPSADDEQEILERRLIRQADTFSLSPVVTPQIFLSMQKLIEQIYVHPDLQSYIVDLVAETRTHRQVVIGASPRGSLALLKLARSWAAIQGRDYVLPDDVKLFAREALSHRLILEPSLWGSKTTRTGIIDEIVQSVGVPVMILNRE
ncbi:MAG: MoxR family ATPase [Anaerolineales bacterium]|nr:MoxR family ATPase [Chloroflexota bacterium]MBL6983391.1 MoxR family ATPase [Anaerolineales bacterium]